MRTTKLRLTRVKVNGERYWQVTYQGVDGKRKRPTFKKRADAQRCFDEIQRFGTAARAAASPTEILRPFGKTLAEAASFYAEHLKSITASRSVAEAASEFQTAAKADGASHRYLLDLKSRLGRFAEDFGSRPIAEIQAREIDEWLRGLRKKTGEKLSPVSRNSFRRRIATLFKFSKTQGWCAGVPETTRVKEVSGEVGILTPDELSGLLKVAADDTLPYWCIGAFAGLRASEIARLDWSDLSMGRRSIRIRPKVSKTASRRIVDIQPNLLKWLAPYRDCTGKVAPKNLRKKLDADRARTGLLAEWPGNALRHSYASYHLAQFNNAAALALQLGHTSQSLIFRHYREVVTPEDAQCFWAIEPKGRPENVIAMEGIA
jgi:integrase